MTARPSAGIASDEYMPTLAGGSSMALVTPKEQAAFEQRISFSAPAVQSK